MLVHELGWDIMIVNQEWKREIEKDKAKMKKEAETKPITEEGVVQ